MFKMELITTLSVIYLGIRIGGIGIGFSSGLGVLILTILFHIKPGTIPFDVIEIIMTVVTAIATMQVAGGINYLVNLTGRILRNHPRYITFFAPLITWFTTFFTGTSHAVFSILPVIVAIAKEQGIRPSRPLSIAVIASQIAVISSPTSAAVILFANIVEPIGISYPKLLTIYIPVTLISIMITALFCNSIGVELKDDPIYQRRLARGEVKVCNKQFIEIKPRAKLSVLLFLIGNIMMIFHTTGSIQNQILSRNEVITVFMLTIAMVISIFCKINIKEVLNASTFKFGMGSCICILGVSWLGDTFIKANITDIQSIAGNLLCKYPWFLVAVLFFAAILLYSQAATIKAIMPVAITLGISPQIVIASFAAVSALFVLPTYPTLLAAVEIDDTGSTYIGKYIFNHVFLIPGILTIALCVIFGFFASNFVM